MKTFFIVTLIWFSCIYSYAQRRIWFDKPNPSAVSPAWGKGKPSPTTGGSHINTDIYWERTTLPIGNGSIGANVFGSVQTERLTFNEKTLWRGGPNTSKDAGYYWNVNKRSAQVLTDIRRAFMTGDIDRATELTQNNFNSVVPYEADAEEPFRFGSFTTCGEFRIATGLSENGISGYSRSLSLDSAIVNVSFIEKGVRYTRDYFCSYPDDVLVIRFAASMPGKQNLVFSYFPNPLSKGKFMDCKLGGFCYSARLENNGMEYAVRVQAQAKGGRVHTDAEGCIHVEAADEVFFVISADTDYKMNFDPDFSDPKTYVGVKPLQTTRKWIGQALEYGYDALLKRHCADYSQLFGRVDFDLNMSWAGRFDSLPTPARLERYRKGYPDYGLETLYYRYGRYLLIASSRPGNMPANLQGIWHNNVDGPWRVDYHNNVNVQMNYWSACPANLPECEWPLMDYIRSLVKSGSKTAEAYFGARGWTASISANIFGFTTPLRDKDMSWNFSPVAGPWLATHVWEFYDFTRDTAFLREIGYDLIKGSARFAVDYLWKKEDGSYTAAPSTSPEHGPVDEGVTFVHAVICELLLDAIAASETLGVDLEEREEWKQVLANLVPYKIGRYGQLQEWSKDIDDPYDEHRHVNHLFGLHPGRTVSPQMTPALAKASKVVLEHRGDGGTGWSMAWKLNQWARLHDGNRSYQLYANLLKYSTNDNLWDSHPPFQIDGNLGGVAGVTEMLLQSHLGFIDLLPALPDVWHEGRLAGVKARGNFTVDLSWKDNILSEVVIYSASGGVCSLRYRDAELEFETVAGQSYEVFFDGNKLLRKEGKTFTVKSKRMEESSDDVFIEPLGVWPTDHKELFVTFEI